MSEAWGSKCHLEKGEVRNKKHIQRSSWLCHSVSLMVKTDFQMARLTSLSLSLTQGQNLSTLSPTILFGPMFQKPEDTAIQEDPQQTGLLFRLSSCSNLSSEEGNSHLLTCEMTSMAKYFSSFQLSVLQDGLCLSIPASFFLFPSARVYLRINFP